ncbi:MAG TPA: alpha/beta fold hydrolase [Candidatus Binatia bacterium]|nr:alpha/beta fold hydrolase [Candidatus Binatia bacterium]
MLYDGPVDGADALWKRVAAERVTAFGTSPAYLQLCEQSGWMPPRDGGATLDFSALRAMYSTGSVLYPRQQEWVWQQVKPVPIQSISGGTDIVGCFVLGNPNLPVYSAEPQCRSLGLDVRALNVDAAGIGELVCANPFPSRPLGLVDDADGRRFHAAYFAQHPGVWTHGDLVEFTAEGSARMHGRSDGVLNVRGIRIGPAEIYRMLADVPEITEAMAIERHADDEPGNARLVLLLVLRQGAALDAELSARIRRLLAQRGSPAHVPAAILAVDQLPTTHSGKRSERSARDALNGRAVVNSAALRNPESLEPLRAWAAQVRPERTVTVPAPAVAEPLAETVARVWREVLDLPAVKPSDNYFDLGGDSLRALKILEVLRRATGREVPLTLLLDAPTLAGFVQALGAAAEHEYRPLVQLQPPRDPDVEPLFIVHGVGGSAMELLGLARLIDDGRAVYGIQARGFDAQDTPSRDVPAMACEYLAAVRGVQPEGPYLLAGYSFGGQVAYEMARQLQEAGDEVGLVALLDTGVPERHWPPAAWFEYFVRRVLFGMRSLRARRAHEWPAVLQGLLRSLRHRVHRRALPPQRLADEYAAHLPETVRRVRCAGFTAALAHPPQRSNLSVHLLRTDLDRSHSCDPAIVWRRCARSVTVHEVPGDHASLIRAPHAAAVARCLAECLATAAPAAAARDLQPPVPLITAEPPHLPRAGVDAAPAPALPPPPADLPASASAWLS